MQEEKFKYVRHATVVEIVGGDREKIKELQTDVTGYTLGEVFWRNRNRARRIWWGLCHPSLKISI